MSSARDRLLQANENNVKKVQATNQQNLIDEITQPVVENSKIVEEKSKVEEISNDYEIERRTNIASVDIPLNPPPQKLTIKVKQKKLKMQPVSLRLYPELYNFLKELADENNTSINDIANQVIAKVYNEQ